MPAMLPSRSGVTITGTRALCAMVCAAALLGSVPQAAQRSSALTSTGESQVALEQVVTTYCATCHNARARTVATASGTIFDNVDLSRVTDDTELWEKVVRRLRAGAMPPAGMPRPAPETTEALVTFLESTLDRAAADRPQPGRHLPARLNRAEYANAIRDLLGLEIDAAEFLPPDDSAAGFDNNADALGPSPALLERYLAAAAHISALTVGNPEIPPSSATYRIRGDASQTDQHGDLPFGTRGGLAALHTFPLDGEYVIRVKLLETNLGSIRGLEHPHELEIAVDGARVLLAPVGGPEDYVQSSLNATNVVEALDDRLHVRVLVRAGQRRVTAAFLRTSQSLGGWRLQPFLRSTLIATDHLGVPHVEHVTVAGPLGAATVGETSARARLFTCRPEASSEDTACAKAIVASLARRAYRRPVTDADLAPLLRFYDAGAREGGFERGIELALRAVLVSPSFIFRIERDPAELRPGDLYPVGDRDLASRLSFFLWSSLPDDELLDAAATGRLSNPDTLDRQVRRMLADPRADALVKNFAGQWLHVRNIRSTTPDKEHFPDFDDNLRQAFERELELFLASLIREDRSILELLTADYTFVNERLARHYGIPHVYGPHFRRVALADETRRGLLGKGGILLVTSHASRTSPVVRGKWILDNLIGMPPPPPPPDVPEFPEDDPDAPQTVRARMERHRANPACASCHRVMDPLGLVLENFDAVGAWRTEEAGTPVDASGVLWDGQQVQGPADLQAALLERPEVLVATVTEKLLTYALARELTPHDMPAVRAIVRRAGDQGYRFSSLVHGVVTSVPFRMRVASGAQVEDVRESP